VCRSGLQNIGGFPPNGSLDILRRLFGNNCTHVIGNVVISDLATGENGVDPDLSFLEHIREITGYLIIMYSNVETIPLTNLRVIRAEDGGYKIGADLQPAALVIRHNHRNNVALRNIDLRNLKSIVQGSVYVYDNPGLCYLSRRVNWTELFETPGEQFVLGKEAVEAANEFTTTATPGHEKWHGNDDYCDAAVCSYTCRNFTGGSQHCWGPDPEECQQESKCNNVDCNRCYSKQGKSICCHEQCLGGCTGPEPTQCNACKEYIDSGTCVAHCPQNPVVKNGEMTQNPQFKYRLGALCVADCPPGFLVESGACVTHCTRPGTHAVGRNCLPCDGGRCPITCKLEYPLSHSGSEKQIINAVNLRSLTNCTHLQGNLVITNESFHINPSIPGHEPIRDIEELWALHSLREIFGYVYLDLGSFGNKLKNFSFLENLVKVSGYHTNLKVSVTIINSGAEIVGLRRLREVPHGGVVLFNNTQLCYIQTLPWVVQNNGPENFEPPDLSRITGTMHIAVHESPDLETCTKRGAICHTSCDPRYGCWGPGMDQCVRCLYYRAGEQNCVKSCDELPGFMYHPLGVRLKQYHSDVEIRRETENRPAESYLRRKSEIEHSFSMGLPDSDHICPPCHPECAHTCSGPGPDECIGDCKIAWAGGQCVSQCDQFHYLNGERRICEPCQIHCHQRRFTNQPVCTGPGRHPGPGGCNKCEKVIVTNPSKTDSQFDAQSRMSLKLVCLRGDCPPGTYLTTEVIHPNSSFAHIAETFTNVLPVCRHCHPLCSECTAHSLVEAGPDRMGCVVCSGVWFRGTCMEQCPIKETYTIDQTVYPKDPKVGETGFTGTIQARQLAGRCLACHSACHMGCWGPEASQCNHCLYVRVHLSIVPEVIRQKEDRLEALFWSVTKQKASGWNLAAEERLGPFMCSTTCPHGLNYSVTDPWSGDRLCYTSTELSKADWTRIMHENSAFPIPAQENIKMTKMAQPGGSKHSHVAITLFWIGLLGLCMLIPVILYCIHRVRQPKKLRTAFTGFNYFLPFSDCLPILGQKNNRPSLLSDMSGPRPHGNPWRGDLMEMSPLCSEQTPVSKRDASTTESNANIQKAPNLGRLVMINSDDLILNEQCGPLGTGAFGAVYRGVWRIAEVDLGTRDEFTSDSTIGNRPCSMQSSSTVCTTMPPTSDEGDEEHGSREGGGGETPPSGSFGIQAKRHSANSSTRYRMLPVAVKILNDGRGSSDLQALLDEAKVMASVSHKHCLPLIGVCLSKSRKCLVSAYVMNGSLERYLRVHALDLPSALLLDWAAQIADGMCYLQSRGIIHREHLQITDFGLAKMLEGEDEEKHGEVIVRSGRVPIRWLAIETLTHGRYSFKTDVWAYGVTLWEIFTFGEKPYERIETANVKAHILSGGRLPQPEICTLELYQVMLRYAFAFDQVENLFFLLLIYSHYFLQTPRSIILEDPYSSVGGDTRSRLTIYPSSMIFSERPDPASTSHMPSLRKDSASPSGMYRSGSINTNPALGSSSTGQQFDGRRRIRSSLLIQPTSLLYPGRFLKYQQQKRSSVGGRADNTTLSTSLSMASSGMSDRWSHSTFPHHSQPALLGVKENTMPPTRGLPPAMFPRDTTHRQRAEIRATLNSDSWASSGQPLLSSDQDSSLSQLILSNLGYTSSDSHSSMVINIPATNTNTVPTSAVTIPSDVANQQITDASEDVTPSTSSPRSDNETIDPTIASLNGLNSSMPADFGLEAAAGYVWPQWPSVFSELNQTVPGDGSGTSNLPDSINEDSLASLNRQLWLRRSAKQRQFYRRQSQLHRHATLGMPLPEQTIEEAMEESASWRHPGRDGGIFPSNQIDEEGSSAERYCPDPTGDN
ncbi:hypothetical protein T265_12870, partial [Opisthorchis viverrini]